MSRVHGRYRRGGENDRYLLQAKRLQEAEKRKKECFAAAKVFTLSFGMHNGRTLDDIASTDKGLLYLDWLRGERDDKKCKAKIFISRKSPVDEALAAYLDDENIQEALQRAIAARNWQ